MRTSQLAQRAIMAACFVVGTGALRAQSTLPPQPDFTTLPPAFTEGRTNLMDVFQPNEPGRPMAAGYQDAEESKPLELGPLRIRPHFFYRVYYDDGILIRPGDIVSSTINEISPGIFLGLGRYITLDCTPTIRVYTSNQLKNDVDQNLIFTVGGVISDWLLGLSQGYATSSTPIVETGTQTSQELYSTDVTASHEISARTSVDLAFKQDFRFAEGFTDVSETSTLNWLNFTANDRTDFGLGLGGGYANVSEGGSDTAYERFLGRGRWRATRKVSFQAEVGGEVRQFVDGSASDLVTPIFALLIQYQPFEPTQLSLSAARAVTPSYFRNQITENTGVRANINQRFFTKLYLNVGGGYATTDYKSVNANSFVTRTDDYYSADVRLTWAVIKRGTISVFYAYLNNSSSDNGFSFESNQVGLELGYRY